MRACLVLLLAATAAFSQTKFEMWPGATYDPAVPTVQKVLAFAPGERIASPEELVRYFDALAAAQPNRIKVFDYAKSWEKRRLIYAAIGSEANIRRLAEIQAGMKRLADPRKTSAAEAQKLIATLPAVIMLAHPSGLVELGGSDLDAVSGAGGGSCRKKG